MVRNRDTEKRVRTLSVSQQICKDIKEWSTKYPRAKVKTEYALELTREDSDEKIPPAKADIAFITRKYKIFVEVESSASGVGTNIAKYWKWMDNCKESKGCKVFVIQVFDPRTFGSTTKDEKRDKGGNYRANFEVAKFVGKKMEGCYKGRFKYISIHCYDRSPECECSDKSDVANYLTKMIEKKIENIIGGRSKIA